MASFATVFFVSLALAHASMAVPILPRTMPTTVDSVSTSTMTSTLTAPSDVPPPPVFTFGPSGLPHASASTTASAPTSSLVLEMDWLS